MKIRRTLPPTAAPIGFGGLWGGVRGLGPHDRRGEMEQQLTLPLYSEMDGETLERIADSVTSFFA